MRLKEAGFADLADSQAATIASLAAQPSAYLS